jgi:hypothetical protein
MLVLYLHIYIPLIKLIYIYIHQNIKSFGCVIFVGVITQFQVTIARAVELQHLA